MILGTYEEAKAQINAGIAWKYNPAEPRGADGRWGGSGSGGSSVSSGSVHVIHSVVPPGSPGGRSEVFHNGGHVGTIYPNGNVVTDGGTVVGHTSDFASEKEAGAAIAQARASDLAAATAAYAQGGRAGGPSFPARHQMRGMDTSYDL